MGSVAERDIRINTLSWVTSLPGSPAGNWHNDHADLYPTNERTDHFTAALPPHAAIAIVPLVNITEEMGPTRFLLKSHVPCPPQSKVL